MADKLYEVSVHDISEAIFTIPTMIDHTGYYSMYKHINETLLSNAKSSDELEIANEDKNTR